MKIYTNVSGTILQIRRNTLGDDFYGIPPTGTSLLEFDEDTNIDIITALISNIQNYTVIGGILFHNGQSVTINPPTPQHTAEEQVKIGYAGLADWARTGTATDAETFINTQVWNGQTIAQVNTWIDTNITNITTANVAQINTRLDFIRQALKLAASAIINMRGLFILTSKLLIYIRDLVLRFRQ